MSHMPVYHCLFEPSAKRMIRSLRQREIACKQTHDMKPSKAVLQGHRHQSKPTHGLCSWTIRRGAGGESVEGSSISQISSCNGWRCSSEMCEWCVMPRHSWLSIVFWHRMSLAWQRLAVERPWDTCYQAGGKICWIPGYLSWFEQLQISWKIACLKEHDFSGLSIVSADLRCFPPQYDWMTFSVFNCYRL